MRVLHIMSGFGGGISSFIINKAKYFNNKEITFDVITFDEVSSSFLKAIKDTGGRIIRISNPKTAGFKKFYQEVNDIMRGLPKSTFIHCHIIGYRAIPFYLIAKKNGLKTFGIHAHTTGMPNEINSFSNRTVRLINNTLSSHKISCGVEASRYLFGNRSIANSEIMHIPNSIDEQQFLDDSIHQKSEVLGVNANEKLVVGHIGRFKSVKNHRLMIDMIEELAKRSVDFIWVFVGDGEDFNIIKSLVHKKNLDDYVVFLGRRQDVAVLLKIMDVFVLPSKYEGFPTVAIESQAASTQTLLSDTITREVDLDLNLIEYISTKDIDKWVNRILEYRYSVIIDKKIRYAKLNEKMLTNKASSVLYKSFIGGEITSYKMV